jgi:hypothetical protein
MLIAGVIIWRDEIFGPAAARGAADEMSAAARPGGGLVTAPAGGAPSAMPAIPGPGPGGGRGQNGRARQEPGPRAGASRAENGGRPPSPGDRPHHDVAEGRRNGAVPAAGGGRGDQFGPGHLGRRDRGAGRESGRQRDRSGDSTRAAQPADRVDPLGPRPVPDVLPVQPEAAPRGLRGSPPESARPALSGRAAGWFRPTKSPGPATVADEGAGGESASARPHARPAQEPPLRPEPGPASTPKSADVASASAVTDGADAAPGSPATGGTVTVVPGIARYHKADCILIRFLGEDDLETMSQAKAEESGCVACRACRPDKDPAGGG